jgi:hypothetical protein
VAAAAATAKDISEQKSDPKNRKRVGVEMRVRGGQCVIESFLHVINACPTMGLNVSRKLGHVILEAIHIIHQGVCGFFNSAIHKIPPVLS